MTREEAINQLKDFIILHRGEHGWDVSTLDALDIAIKALEQRWIPVSERLPEVDVDVLVTDNGGGVPTVIIDACGVKDDTGDRFWYISQTPVAWMDWPVQYKAESDG